MKYLTLEVIILSYCNLLNNIGIYFNKFFIFIYLDSRPLCRDDLDIHIVQNLTFSLGMEGTVRPPHSMATVCKFSRNVLFPPQFKTIQEWFNYAFAMSEIDGKYCIIIM